MTARTKLAALEHAGSLARITAALLLAWIASRLFPHSPVAPGPDQLLILSVLSGLYGYVLATRALDRWLSPVMDRIEDQASA